MTLRENLKNHSIAYFLHWFLTQIFLFFVHFFPLQKKIVFNNFNGRELGDDPKYILLQLVKDKVKAKYIWLTNDLSIKVPDNIKKIRYGSWKASYHYLTAKIWIDNVKSNPKPPKRNGQFYLQTWHGSFANKKVEKDVEKFLSKDYIRQSQEDSSKIDLMYSNNDFKINLFKRAFWYNGPVIKSDSPQLSVLINPPPNLRNDFFSKYNINQAKKIILYAPTFRKETNLNIYKWNYKAILNTIEEKFNAKFVFLIRLHPNISQMDRESFGQNVLNVTSYPDMDELMAISDIMITDFSGVAYDMALVKKPVFLFAQDFEVYTSQDRPQYFPNEQLPFTFAKDITELEENIRSFNSILYQNKVDSFFDKIGLQDSGNGAQSIAKIVMEKL